MSRSKWAWTEGCALVRAVVRGADERVARASLLGAVSSTKRLVRLMAASVLVIGVAPAPALAGSVSGSHAKTRTPNKQYSAHVDRASAVVLALGSGYSSRGGAARVRALQRRLAGLGFAPGPVDGRYGPRTEQAVDRFQAVRGLRVDGIAGAQTLAQLGNQQSTLQQATRPSRPTGSHRPANRSSRPPAPGKLVPATHSTGSPSLGLLVLLIALVVALGLSATWLAARRHHKRYADADAGANRASSSDPADAIAAPPTRQDPRTQQGSPSPILERAVASLSGLRPLAWCRGATTPIARSSTRSCSKNKATR
jgi:peptidoglycan hydrolase-like protein with peptidoglycan-binding domain